MAENQASVFCAGLHGQEVRQTTCVGHLHHNGIAHQNGLASSGDPTAGAPGAPGAPAPRDITSVPSWGTE